MSEEGTGVCRLGGEIDGVTEADFKMQWASLGLQVSTKWIFDSSNFKCPLKVVGCFYGCGGRNFHFEFMHLQVT